MAELEELEWELAGLLMGGSTPYDMLDNDGLEGSATHDSSSTNRQGDGVAVHRKRMRDRLVELTIGLTADSTSDEDMATLEAQKDALRAVVYRMADGVTPRLLRWRHWGVTKRVEVRPADGEPITFSTGDDLVYGCPTAKVRLHVADPNVYADTPKQTAISVPNPSTPDDFTVTNDGPLCADPRTGSATLGVWTLSMTAGGAGCQSPYLVHTDFPRERWVLAETFPAGGTASIGYDRTTYRGGVRRSAGVQGADSSPIPGWLWLRPGDNDLRMGCASGSFDATFTHRDTY